MKLDWNKMDWKLVNTRVRRLQARIFSAASEDFNSPKVHYLQTILIHSLDAKLISVKKITTENKGKKTNNVNRKVYLKPEEKSRLVQKLKVDGKTSPIQQINITKSGFTEKNTREISTILDRSKQTLVLLALEPQWETIFEPNSFGFRPGRSIHDAIEATFLSMRRSKSNYQGKFVAHISLNGCFNNLDHEYLLKKLQTTSTINKQIAAWLKSGILDERSLSENIHEKTTPNITSIRKSDIISSFLINVALHGIEINLKNWIKDQKWEFTSRHASYTTNKEKSISLIRYADDFVLIHSDKSIAYTAMEETANWLWNTSKFRLDKKKIIIKSSKEGFDFLGFSLISIKKNGKLRTKIYPSKENQKNLISKVGHLCRKYRALSTYELIKVLRPVTLEWGNYFRTCECKEVFGKMDRLIFQILRSWVFRRDKRHGRKKVKEKYFPSGKTYIFDGNHYKNNWVLNGKQKLPGEIIDDIFLPKLSWIKSRKHVKVQGNYSVYNRDHRYWTLRSIKYSQHSKRIIHLLKIQEGRCKWCNGYFDTFSTLEIDHIIPRQHKGKDVYSNLQLLHRECHVQKTLLEDTAKNNIN